VSGASFELSCLLGRLKVQLEVRIEVQPVVERLVQESACRQIDASPRI
jgi:hypothetical protein